MRSNPGLVMAPERFLLVCVTDHGFCLVQSSLFRQQLWVQSQEIYLFYITEQLSSLYVFYSAIFVNTGLTQSVPSSSNFSRYFQYNCIADTNTAAFLVSLLFTTWGSPWFWVGFGIHSYTGVFQLTITTLSLSPYHVFGLCLSKAGSLPGSWSNVETYGTNIELYIFQELLLSIFLCGVTSSKSLMTFCFLFKDKYFLSFYMLHTAFQKHAGEFETPAVSFPKSLWRSLGLILLIQLLGSCRVRAPCRQQGNSFQPLSLTQEYLGLTCLSLVGAQSSQSYHDESTWNLCDSDKNSHFSIPVRCVSMLKSSKAKHEQSEKMHSYTICSQNLDKNYIGEVEIITAGLF